MSRTDDAEWLKAQLLELIEVSDENETEARELAEEAAQCGDTEDEAWHESDAGSAMYYAHRLRTILKGKTIAEDVEEIVQGTAPIKVVIKDPQ